MKRTYVVTVTVSIEVEASSEAEAEILAKDLFFSDSSELEVDRVISVEEK